MSINSTELYVENTSNKWDFHQLSAEYQLHVRRTYQVIERQNKSSTSGMAETTQHKSTRTGIVITPKPLMFLSILKCV